MPVTNLEAGCENKCASPYIGERFGENSVGGKWLMGAVLRIPLTLTGRGNGALGGEIILLNRAMQFTQPPPTGWGFYGPNRRLTEALVLDPIQSVNRTLLFLKALPTHLKSLLLSLPPLAIGIVASCLMINPSKQVTLPLQTLVNVCWSTVCILFWLSLTAFSYWSKCHPKQPPGFPNANVFGSGKNKISPPRFGPL